VDDMLGQKGLCMGPGIGIQVPKSGRLLAMGKGLSDGFAMSNHDTVIASDDHGKSRRER
jgi:hypothetical protein